jgi:hypothetical protein
LARKPILFAEKIAEGDLSTRYDGLKFLGDGFAVVLSSIPGVFVFTDDNFARASTIQRVREV